MRGEICIGTATTLCFISVLLLIFAHVGQINTSTIPRGVAMAKVNMTFYGEALQISIGDPVEGLYTTNATAPLGQAAGLRPMYKFGLYSYCAYVDGARGTCSNTSAAYEWQPYADVLADMRANYSAVTIPFIPDTLTFTNSHYLGEFSKAAYYMLLFGSICAGLALFVGIPRGTIPYAIASVFALFGTLMLLIGVVIWTVIINKAQGINNAHVIVSSQPAPVPLGIVVSVGPGLWLFWASFVFLMFSIVPYVLSAMSYR